MKCPKCQFENPADAKFCNECGSKLEYTCSACGKLNPPGSKFCNECGQSLTKPRKDTRADLSFDEKIAKIQRYLPEGLTEKILSQRDRIEGERKQVTVMFCDMEGFTALTERLGPEEAYSIMDDVYEILIHKVHDYEGTVNEMTGDGIVALFGAPIALEDAPQRAIRSAIAIHREMTKFSDRIRKEKEGVPVLKMRIGIHTGPVVVGTLGNDLRVEFKAVGDTVNLASRMQALAAPGTTYVTETTFRFTEGLFRSEALGAKQIKGKEGRVNVYQVIAPSTSRSRFDVSAERGLTPFVGRDRELEILLDGFQRAKEGAGQAFSIVAEAGLGKSRLLYEFRKAVTNEDVTFLEGRSLSYSRGIAYHPVIDILKSIYDIKEDDGVSQIREKVKEGVKVTGADEAATLPYLLDLLSAEDKEIESAPLTPEARKERIIEALKGIVLKGSEIRPLIMAFEDLHWADRSSEDVLKILMESIPGARVLLLFTYRPEFVHTWGGKSYHSQLNLNRLSNRESLAMVTHLLGTKDIDRALEELILKKTEGVPFFVEEFVKSLRDLKVIVKENSRYRLAEHTQAVMIPSTVQDVVMARIDSLPEGAKEVLQTGSVIDREFSYALIKRVTELPEEELLSRLSGLRDSELIYERGVYPRSNYIFKHALAQEVAYNSLLLKRRKEIHAKIGRAIESLYPERLEEYCELLAYHYTRSDNREEAVEYLDLANQKAARAIALEEARIYFDDAMKLLDALPPTEPNQEHRISLLVNQRTVFNLGLQAREYYDLLTAYAPLLADLGNTRLQGAYKTRMAFCEWATGLFDQAIQTSSEAIRLCEISGNAEDIGEAYSWILWSCMSKGDFESVLAFKEEAMERIEGRFTPRSLMHASLAASMAYACLGRWDEAVQEGERALQVARESSDKSLLALASAFLATIYTLRGDMVTSIELAQTALEKAPTPADKAWSEACLGYALCRAGDTGKGIALMVQTSGLFRGAHHLASLLGFLPSMGEAYLLAEEVDKARQTAEEILELSERHKANWALGRAYRLLGEIGLRSNLNRAPPDFEKAIYIFREIKSENELALAYSGMGRYHKQKGNRDQARKYLTDALAIFERLGTLIEPDKMKKELADLTEAG